MTAARCQEDEEQEIQEVTVSLAAAEEISLDVAAAAMQVNQNFVPFSIKWKSKKWHFVFFFVEKMFSLCS